MLMRSCFSRTASGDMQKGDAGFANRDGKPPTNHSHCSVNGIKSVRSCAYVPWWDLASWRTGGAYLISYSQRLFKFHWNIIFILFRVESEPGRHMCSCVMNSNPKRIWIETGVWHCVQKRTATAYGFETNQYRNQKTDLKYSGLTEMSSTNFMKTR